MPIEPSLLASLTWFAHIARHRSFTKAADDAYHLAEAFLTQPILAVAGSVAGSKWMSEALLAHATSTDKTLHVVDGANHMSLYDVPQYVNESVSQLAPFFRAKLAG